jgi:hypothetical protein
MCYLILNSVGLLLDIIGVGLTFYYGLPDKMLKKVDIMSVHSGYSSPERELELWSKERKLDRINECGFALLITASVMQFLSNTIQVSWSKL